MTDLRNHGTPETDVEAMSRQRQNLDYVRQELIEYRPDIVDADLRTRVTRFLAESTDLPPASAREYISKELHDIRETNAMRRRTGVTDPEDEFPDRCKGCEHYGVRCPVLTKTSEIDRRKRIFRETDGPQELRRKLRDYAIDNDCHVIKDSIDAIVDEHEPIAAEGQLLLMLVEERLHFGETDEAVTRMLTNKIQQVRQKRLDDPDEPGIAARDEDDAGDADPAPGPSETTDEVVVADGGGEGGDD